jgi:predicted DNA-binding transcriptional regulator YafY
MSPKSVRREKQIVRILSLLTALLEGDTPTVPELAARFHTRRETIYRDLHALEDSGFPISGDENGQLSHPRLLDKDSRGIARMNLSEQEIAALIWAAGHRGSQEPFGKVLQSATLKLRFSAATKEYLLASKLDQVMVGRSRGRKNFSAHQGIILLLVEAIISRRVCKVTYQAPGGEPKGYTYHPYRLSSIQGGLYCLGRLPQFEDVTTFAIERILELDVTKEKFPADTRLDLERRANEAFGVVWEEPMNVVLWFRPDQGPYAVEREWHPTQRSKTLADGRIELTFRAGGMEEIVHWILRWGDAVEVIRPLKLRRKVSSVLQHAAQIYENLSL